MKKIFLITFLIFFNLLQISFADVVTIQKGTLVRVYPNGTISTALNQENDSVYFINPSDLWINETNAIPQNSIFEGYINFLKMPVQGINAAFSMKIVNLKLPNGKIYPLDATVQSNGQSQIGGEQTNPTSYNYTIHKQPPIGWFGGIQGVLQYVPSGEYEFGTHTTLSPKDALFIIFNEDLEIEN